MRLAKSFCCVILCISSHIIWAQEEDYAQQLEDLFAEMDSMSIFSLIDSALSISNVKVSELNIRAAYSSNVAIAGRNYGINQHGFAPGISYYHKSGLFGDATGLINSAFDPKYNLTLLSLGYFGTKKKFSYIPSYERWIYNDDPTASLFNSLGISLNQSIKFLNIGVDYSFLFGRETAHRLIVSGGGYLTLKDIWFFDAISIMPTIAFLFGNDEITTQRFSDDQVLRPLERLLYPIAQLTPNQQQIWIRSIIRNGRINEERIREFQENLEQFGTILTPERISSIEARLNYTSQKNVFGMMNLNLSFPIFFTIDRFNISLNYSYNIPYALPGELYEFDPIGFAGISVNYRIPFGQ